MGDGMRYFIAFILTLVLLMVGVFVAAISSNLDSYNRRVKDKLICLDELNPETGGATFYIKEYPLWEYSWLPRGSIRTALLSLLGFCLGWFLILGYPLIYFGIVELLGFVF